MSDTSPPPASHAEHSDHPAPSPVAELNARTARRQKLLMGAIGALVLVGGSWFILGGDDKAASSDPDAAQTIDTAGIVNRDLANREFVATYSNRIDAVTQVCCLRSSPTSPSASLRPIMPGRSHSLARSNLCSSGFSLPGIAASAAAGSRTGDAGRPAP